MRLFFAIVPPKDVIDYIARVQNRVKDSIGREGIRWELPDKFHITVRFLGEVLPEQLDAVKSAGRAAAEESAPFELTLSGIGTFPQRRAARVVWLGAESSVPGFSECMHLLESKLAAAGFSGERKSSAGDSLAHVTLARLRSLGAGKSALREISKNNSKNTDIKAVFFVYNIVLVESELRPDGSRYTILETFPLNASSAAIDPSPLAE